MPEADGERGVFSNLCSTPYARPALLTEFLFRATTIATTIAISIAIAGAIYDDPIDSDISIVIAKVIRYRHHQKCHGTDH